MAQNNSTAVMDVDTVEKEKKMKVKKSEMLKLNKFIYEVLKKVHPDIAISAGAVELMNTILTDMMLKLAQKASKHNKIRHKNSPLVEPDISAAVREVFPEDMAGLALLSALKSVIRMNVEDILQNNLFNVGQLQQKGLIVVIQQRMCKGDDMRITGAQGFPLFALVVWLESGTGKLLQRRVEFLESCSKTYI